MNVFTMTSKIQFGLLLLGAIITFCDGQKFAGAYIGTTCESSDVCERTVIDSECKDSRCDCIEGAIQRSVAICELKERSLYSIWDVYELTCESTDECDVPRVESKCKRNYQSTGRGSGLTYTSSDSAFHTVKNNGVVTLKFSSDVPIHGNVIVVNHEWRLFESGGRSISAGHIKVKMPPTNGYEVEIEECTSGQLSCTKHVRKCNGTCDQPPGITEFVYGLRTDCSPAAAKIGESCYYDKLCMTNDDNSVCSEDRTCKCKDGFRIKSDSDPICTKIRP